jgi:2-polyprenyl-3-methyl-5-hydroxy-6-metoxy-1,4-benzoquinol methylase
MSELESKPPEPLDPSLYDDFYRLKGILYEKVDPRQQEPISSRVPIFGPLIIAIKKGIRNLLGPIINMTLLRQTHFNENLVQLLTRLVDHHHDEYIKGFKSQNSISWLVTCLKELQQENLLLKNRLDRLLEATEGKLGAEKIGSLIKEEKDSLWDHQYFRFENRYRGFEAAIKKKQEMYLPFFKSADQVLDIGCGRGEFLSLLKENGIAASGIDLNEDMVHICKKSGLSAEKVNAFDYLKTLEDGSLGGIFAAHVIEHVGNDRLREFVQLCSNKLKSGGTLIYETPNPHSIVVSSTSFYLDLTHINPIHPETIQFLLDSCGIAKSEIKYLSPFPIEKQLEKISLPSTQSARETVEQINQNIEHLNQVLYGFQDYAVIGKKP